MPEATDPHAKALFNASWAVETLLEDLAGLSVNDEVRDRVVEGVMRAFTDEGLILVRADLGESIAQKVELGCPEPDAGEHPCDYPLAAQIDRDAFKPEVRNAL